MSKLIVDHVYGYLVPDPERQDEIVAVVDDATSWSVPGAQFSPAYQRWVESQTNPEAEAAQGEKWDGCVHLLTAKLRFPAGLIHVISDALNDKRLPFTIDDRRMYPTNTKFITELEGVTLRGDQIAAVRAGLLHRRGIFKAPPGSGKTEMMIALVASLEVYPVIWLTHLRKLINQTYERFQARLEGHNITVGRIGEGRWELGAITVTSVAALWRSRRKPLVRDLLHDAQVVVSDEVHHEPSTSWHKLLMKCQAPYRFGCSATPLDRGDESNLRLVGAIGRVIYELTVQEGARLGVFEVPRVVFIQYHTRRTIRSLLQAVDWREVYREGIVQSEERNSAILAACERCMDEGRRTLLLVHRLAHGRLLEEKLQDWFDCTERARFIQGSDPTPVREEAIDKFRRGIIRILISSSILDEGADIPEIGAVIIAAGGKSTIKAVQRAGRGMRKQKDMDLVVYDFEDTTDPALWRHTELRRGAYERFCGVKAQVWNINEKSV